MISDVGYETIVNVYTAVTFVIPHALSLPGLSIEARYTMRCRTERKSVANDISILAWRYIFL